MSLDIQRMIRDQANETRDELQKMVSWEAEIQSRDDQLIALAREGKFGYVPPETTRVTSKKGTTTTTSAPQPKKVPIQPTDAPADPPSKKAAAPRNYKQWDALDAKLKQQDAEGEEADPRETAEEHKTKGNDFYKKKNYSLAIREYSAAQKLDPSNPIYFFNRATAYFQLSNFVESEKDASRAISLDPRYTKAFVRRGLARDAQGKLEVAMQDLEAADGLEPGVPSVVNKLKEIRQKLGISADGRIRQIQEPKVAVVEEEPEQPKRRGPRVEVVDERPLFQPLPPSNPKPAPPPGLEPAQPGKVKAVAEEASPPPAKAEIVAEEAPSPLPTPGKIKIVTEEATAPPPPALGKVKIVVEEEPTPGRVAIVAEEEPAPGRVGIVAEEEAALPEPEKVRIIAEEEPLPPAPTKVRIVVEEEAVPPAPVKVAVSAEEEPARPKVEVVAEGAPKPANVRNDGEEEQAPPPVKVRIVSEEPPATVEAVDVSEAVTVVVDAETTAPKKGRRPANIKVEVDDLDSPRPAPPPEKNPAAKTAPAKKPPQRKAAAIARKKKDFGKSWADLRVDEYAPRLAQLAPRDLNESLGLDWSGFVVLTILKTLVGSPDTEKAFEFVEQLGWNPELPLFFLGQERILGLPLLIQIIENSRASPGRKDAVRSAWEVDK
jgi:hypothetical protein